MARRKRRIDAPMERETVQPLGFNRAQNIDFERVDYAQYMERALHGEPEQGSKAASYGRSTRKEKSVSFYGTTTWEEAVALAEDGWSEGREMVGQILTNIEAAQHDVSRPICHWDVTGDFVDVGAYVSGEPECMVSWQAQPESKRIARILVNLSASGSVSCETLRWRGATVLALIDRLENADVRCEVDIGLCNKEDGKYWTICANVKRADEPLHIDRLAFHLAHPSSLRRIMWSFAETGPAHLVNDHHFYDGGWYGMPVSEIRSYLPEGEKYDLIVPGLQLLTITEALDEIERMFDIVCPTKREETFDVLTDSV